MANQLIIKVKKLLIVYLKKIYYKNIKFKNILVIKIKIK